MKHLNKYLLMVLSVVLCGMSIAQEQDARIWAGLSASKKINNKIKTELSGQLRFYENASMLQTSLIQIGLRYKFNDYVSITPGYRYIADQDLAMGTLPVHRFFTDVKLRYNSEPISLLFRNRYQVEYHDLYAMENHPYKDIVNRVKLVASFELGKPFKPYIYGEVYYLLNDPAGAMASKYRLGLGSSYKLNDYNEIKAFYMYQHTLNTGPYKVAHIFGLSYSVDLEALFGVETKAQDS